MKNYKIAVAGTGYVGLSLGVLLSQHHQVVAVDIVQAKVDMINNKKSPIQDDYIEKYLAEKDLNLTATLDAKTAYSDPDAPLPHITPHVFRHTFCTNMANAGMDIKALQYVMGHSDASITLNVYTHASYDHAAEQMAKLVDFPGASDQQERKMSG